MKKYGPCVLLIYVSLHLRGSGEEGLSIYCLLLSLNVLPQRSAPAQSLELMIFVRRSVSQNDESNFKMEVFSQTDYLIEFKDFITGERQQRLITSLNIGGADLCFSKSERYKKCEFEPGSPILLFVMCLYF